jgi:hypothetical protein
MICVLCYPRETRRGKVHEGDALPLCARCVAEARWFRRLQPLSEYKMSLAEEMIAREALLKASAR